MPLNYFTPILILGVCLYVIADLHFFMVQSRLYSYTFIYLLIIDFILFFYKKWVPDGQPYYGFSVARCHFQLPGAIGQPLSSNPANI